MKDGFVKSSPFFFRLITRSMLLLAVLLLLLSALFPAPLHVPANPALTPNPVKSAWFLLWIQELVSWSRFMIYPLVGVAALYLFLPWLPRSGHIHRACWFPHGDRLIAGLTVCIFGVIILLTVVGLFFRGINWSFTLFP